MKNKKEPYIPIDTGPSGGVAVHAGSKAAIFDRPQLLKIEMSISKRPKMKRKPVRLIPQLELSFEKTAELFDVDERTLYRWCELGHPRLSNGNFAYPETGL